MAIGPAADATLREREGHSVGYNLAVIAVVVGIVGLGLAYLIDANGRRPAAIPTAGTVLTRTLGATSLTIPAEWLRDDADRTEGFAKQVDLALELPLGPSGVSRQVDITLMPRSRIRPSASLLDGVYLHQFATEQLTGPPGLIGKPLQAADGYANETVWYDPLSPAPFTAKCSAPIATGEAGRCLRAVYLGPGIAAVYAFDEDVLANWRQFDDALHPSLAKIGAL